MDTAAALASLGWRVNTSARLAQATKDFQLAWNLGPALTVDGNAGPATQAALTASLARKAAGLGDISEHFSAVEFRCACGGVDPTCRRIWPVRELVRACEVYRATVGPLSIERGCRCPTQNTRVGGAKNSQHLYGSGADVSVYRVSVAKVMGLRVASGIGTYTWGGVGYPRHIDVRHVFRDSRNTTGSSIASPARWTYGAAKSAPLAPRPVTDPSPEEDDMFTDTDRARLKALLDDADGQTLRDDIAALAAKVDTLAAPVVTLDPAQLETALRNVLGSLDTGANP